jgi:hypothetical protein
VRLNAAPERRRNLRPSARGGCQSVDVNKDGVVTEEEFMAQVTRDFDRYDYDKDGVLAQ